MLFPLAGKRECHPKSIHTHWKLLANLWNQRVGAICELVGCKQHATMIPNAMFPHKFYLYTLRTFNGRQIFTISDVQLDKYFKRIK